jgi:hypothetical protein
MTSTFAAQGSRRDINHMNPVDLCDDSTQARFTRIVLRPR